MIPDSPIDWDDEDDGEDDSGEEWKGGAGRPDAGRDEPVTRFFAYRCEPVPGALRVPFARHIIGGHVGGSLLCPHCFKRYIYATGLTKHLLKVHDDMATARALDWHVAFVERPNAFPLERL